MNADEAWDDYVRTNAITKGNASLQGQLSTMQAQMNELSTAVQLLSQVANKVLGQQNEAQAMAAGAAPSADPMAGGAPPMAGGMPGADPMAAGGAMPPAADPMAAMAGGAPPGAAGPEGGVPPEGVPPGAEGMAPPAGAGAPEAPAAPPEMMGGDEEVSLQDPDLMSALAGSEEPMPEEAGTPAEEPVPEEPVPEEPVPEEPMPEASAEGAEGPAPADDIQAAYESFITALKDLAHVAVSDNRLYLVDAIANGINAISSAYGSKICPILDELGILCEADNGEAEGENAGGAPDAENVFSKSYQLYKSAPLVKGMSRKDAVAALIKSGWTIAKMDESKADPGVNGTPVEETSDTVSFEESENDYKADEKEVECGPANKSAEPGYQSFRELMLAKSGHCVGSISDFDAFRIEKAVFSDDEREKYKAMRSQLLQDAGELTDQDLYKMVHLYDETKPYANFKSPVDALRAILYAPSLNFGNEIEGIQGAYDDSLKSGDLSGLEQAIQVFNDRVKLIPLLRERAVGYKNPIAFDRIYASGKDPNGQLAVKIDPKSPKITDRYRVFTQNMISPRYLNDDADPDQLFRLYSNLLDYGNTVLDDARSQIPAPEPGPSEPVPEPDPSSEPSPEANAPTQAPPNEPPAADKPQVTQRHLEDY